MATSSQNQGLSKYVTLVSSDGFEFVVLRDAACISGAIKRMLDPKSKSAQRCIDQVDRKQEESGANLFKYIGGFAEATTGRCEFEEIK